ncbi:pancreatic triacylglycerol lipase [Dendroctonus ponderosae]|uniref:pancreatic triacylglycerol lipase n=1 Tax=Dendroctonus ponderosae TaxID=77166 RepID=UPI002036362E|nr:pancreatic triacylglycerol lipase [Dendroctonus ponderosae]KAH1029394.1 hypothetical protein HUJ05_002644 [Dendroctonus ponderosae]
MKYALYFSLVSACLLAAAQAINPDDVSYVFYTRELPDGFLIKSNTDSNVNKLLRIFDPTLPTVVLIHGWQDDYESNSNTYVKDAIFSKTNANVFKVDWSPLSRLGYLAARDSVPPVGKEAATFIQRLSTAFNYPLIDFTLVGFSLGAHIAGNIGKALKGKIGLIIALDPAGPFISSTNSSFSVYPTDAKYVQGIHTNGGTLGMLDPVGHSDFYPNGGARQPGCGIDLIGNCAHNRAWQLFAESVTDNRFVASSCATLEDLRATNCPGKTKHMGGLARLDRSAKGLYYLETNNNSPFGRA